ncbi:hypothetical protein [Fortiea contorta]|uniref:hypothetical protein n=1 Tax=Fortiea contorta TaxID=1892405 RepID=UPI001EE6621C|nr:hypothetical protein [Fortiea contorta]
MPQQSEIADKISQLGRRLSCGVLALPFVVSGWGYIPEAAQAQIIDRGGNGCPAGSRLGRSNFLINGNFATNAGTGEGVYTVSGPVPARLGFTSDLPYRGDDVYPDDVPTTDAPNNQGGGGLSIQTGAIDYFSILSGRPFPGDPANNVPPSNTYLYSNPNALATSPTVPNSAIEPGNPKIWGQTVTGLQPNTTYNFIAYFYNLLRTDNPSVADAVPPIIVLRITSPATGNFIAGTPTTVATKQQWIPVQFAFTTEANETSVNLAIFDQANNIFGDDFGLTAIALNQCIPTTEIFKSVRRLRDNDNNGVLNVGDDLEYTILVRNSSTTESVTELVIRDAIPAQLQVLRDGSNPIQFPSGFSAAASLPTSSFNGNGTGSPITFTNPGTLAVGQTITLKYNARILPGATSPIANQALANFSGDGGRPILSDASDSTNPGQPGSGNNPGNPDTNGNVNQPNNSPNEPTIVNLGGAISTGNRLRLVKRITSATRGGVPISGLSFTGVEADADADAINQANLRPVGLREIPATTPLQSGDDVQYTIYFLGEQALENFNFCDLIPQGTTYIPSSISIVGAGTGADQGRFFSPLTPLEQIPENSACQNRSNPNGTVIVKLGNVPGGRPGSVSFRVKIN